MHCPNGIDSWWKYKKDKITEEKSYQPSAGVPNHIKEVKPVYARFSEKALLEQCLHGKTLNQNEALNKMMWERAPKETFIGFQEIETATFDAIANLNIGATARINVLKPLGIDPGQYTMEGCSKIDVQGIKSAEYKEKYV